MTENDLAVLQIDLPVVHFRSAVYSHLMTFSVKRVHAEKNPEYCQEPKLLRQAKVKNEGKLSNGKKLIDGEDSQCRKPKT